MIEDIITELETIADAFESVGTFIYNRPSAVNWKDRVKVYPCILVDSQIDVDPDGTNKSDLIKKWSYSLRIFVYDEFSITEQNTTTLQAKQNELETIMDQYVGEIRRRTKLDPTKGFMIESVNGGFHAFPVHNDKLAQFTLPIQLIGDSSCGTGNFDYD